MVQETKSTIEKSFLSYFCSSKGNGKGRILMEKLFLKSIIYSFVVGIFIAILYYPDIQVIQSNGVFTSYTVPLREYIFKVIRFATYCSIIAAGVVVLSKWKEGFEFLKNYLKGFIITLVIMIVVIFLFRFMF
ncbi:hypothetical protein [Paenibacillus sp. Soil522]|uniref:hypothetical protein n=1 Tax=Paenibacillus sp. Soil522 TaxID=1736388 RepID=UPI000701998C|nr:hypothetical protein [Paenibacillus sp. Soil522]KRE41693.1 hypothetical protein ASG81_16430 [Paenibacillus sp. Soil522]